MSISKSDRNMSSIAGSPRKSGGRKASIQQYIFKERRPTAKVVSHVQDVTSPSTNEKKVRDRPENKTEN